MTNEHDEDYEDHPPRRGRPVRPAPGSNRKVWVVVLAVGCGGALLCVAACAGFAFWGVKTFTEDMQPAQAAADQFFERLQKEKVEEAYGSTSANFRANQSSADFAAYVKRFETLTRHTSRTMNGFRIFHNGVNKHAFIQTTLSAPNNAMTCTLVLVAEGGTWKVDKLTVP